MFRRFLLILMLLVAMVCASCVKRDYAFYKSMRKMNTTSLIHILENDRDILARKHAAHMLGLRGDNRSLKPLINSLVKDRHYAVRVKAAEALGKMGDPAGVDPLIGALDDLNEYVRYTAVCALVKLSDTRSVESLIHTLKVDNSSTVRSIAADGLGEIGDNKAIDPLIQALKNDKFEDVRSNAAKALGKIGGARSVDPLIAALREDNLYVRVSAAEALGALSNARAVIPLLDTLENSEDSDVRYGAAEALGKIGDIKSVETLISVLKTDDNADVRASAAMALGNMDSSRVVGSLINAFNDGEHVVEKAAETAVVQIGGPAVESLIAALRDESPRIGYHSASALGKIGDLRAVIPLIKAVTYAKFNIFIISEAMRTIGEPAVEILINALEEKKDCSFVASMLGEIGEPAVGPLISRLNDEDDNIRMQASIALGNMDIKIVKKVIQKWVDDVEKKIKEPNKADGTPVVFIPIGGLPGIQPETDDDIHLITMPLTDGLTESSPFFIVLGKYSGRGNSFTSETYSFDCWSVLSDEKKTLNWCNNNYTVYRIPSNKINSGISSCDLSLSWHHIPLLSSIPVSQAGFHSSADSIPRFIVRGNSVVQDTQTGLMWTAKDNGEDINWHKARIYCETFKGGDYNDWRMPSISELTTLYDKKKKGYKPEYGVSKKKVYITESINLTGYCLWGSEKRNNQAVYFSFYGGFWSWSRNLNSSKNVRVLAVRGGK